MRKYIIVPEYAPLYALRKCFGPTKGPLSRPTLVPVDLIGELLHQTGKEKVSIFEVVPVEKGFSEPVQLTLTNYMLPYEEIVGKTPVPVDAEIVPVEEETPAVVEPEIVSAVPEVIEDQAPEAPEEPVVADAPEAPVVETTEVTEEEKEADPAELVANVELAEAAEIPQSDLPAEPEEIDYSKMTKAERRRLRRELAAQNSDATKPVGPQE